MVYFLERKKSMRLLENRWALVTGSSRGIGREIILGLAKRKCNVIVHGREISHTRETADLAKACGVRVAAVAGDLGTRDGIDAILRGAAGATDRVDILYNNAAIQNAWKSVWEITLDEWQAVFQVNLFAMVALCNGLVPGMLRRGYGRIINLTSGIQDTPCLAPYGVSKAAVDKYTRDLAAELRGTNVLVSYLDPGWLKTDMGGPNAEHEAASVLPGALVPALLEDNGPSGRFYAAQDFKYLD
jgi:NAD(P)-dependent dehydrogenase (short-subunit alcohol dehydrogenase family)